MSLNGQLELSLNLYSNEERRLGFLGFSARKGPKGNFLLTARVSDDTDKKKYKKWKCDVTIGKSCISCGQNTDMTQLRQVTLKNDAPSSIFSLASFPASSIFPEPFALQDRANCDHQIFKLFLLVFIHDESVPECDSGSELEEKKNRFTDEAEAKKLNANLKIRFEDSDDRVFVNRELLSVYSNVFRVMFESDFKEKNAEEIKIGMNYEDFLSFLECLYLPPAPITSRNFKTVVMIADIYDCPYLLQNCKKFGEEEAKTLSTVEECKDLIAIAEHLGWQDIMTAAVHVDFIVDLLDWEWMMARKKTTVNVLFAQMRNLLYPGVFCVILSYSQRCYPMFVSTTWRFTDEAEAKKRNANLKIHFEDSDEPVFVNREVLGAYSNFFRAMFEGDFKEKDVKLEVKREDFLYFLDCLYFPTAEVTVDNFKAVLMMAKRFDCLQLFDKCKEFAEKEASKARTIEDCKDYIEVAEHLDWNNLAVIDSMKNNCIDIFMDLLVDDWIDERKPSTQQALCEGLKEFVMARVK